MIAATRDARLSGLAVWILLPLLAASSTQPLPTHPSMAVVPSMTVVSVGWNLFVTDAAGTSTLAYGRHTLTLEVSGGDGCVEVDVVTLSPDGAGASTR